MTGGYKQCAEIDVEPDEPDQQPDQTASKPTLVYVAGVISTRLGQF